MEFNLDESSLNILQNIFEWTDIDSDGKVSRQDLLNSLGLSSEEDADQLFRSLKDLAGSDPLSDYLTFEEYCKGIMDFPLLLDKFRQEFQVKSVSTFQIPERSESNSSMRDSAINFLPVQLKNSIILYNKILKLNISELDSSNVEDLLEALRMCLEGLKNKSRSETLPVSDILNGTIELYLLVRDLSRFHEEVVSEKNEENYELRSQIETLSKKYERVMDHNEKLMNNINKLEVSRENFSRVNEVVNQEKKKLELELAKAEEKEIDYNSYMQQIESVILDKEKEIARMEKQIRQLNSLKTLQEMRVTTGRPTEEMKVHRLAQIKYRQSVPVNHNSPDRSHKPTGSNSDIKVTIISNQLKKKNEEIQIKALENDELVYKSQRFYDENFKLREENQRLNEKIRNIFNEFEHKRTEDRESLLLPSLYDELQMIKEGSAGDFQKSVIYHHVSDLKASRKSFVSVRDFYTQTDEMKLVKKDKNEAKERGCCSWF
jgi:hypothetical protein